MTKLPEIAEAMLDPQTYPVAVKKVELVQTQMSFLFLTDKHVYKVKKPVNLGFLDYSTLEKRLDLSHKEVELNRRLCPEVYLGVVPIVRHRGQYFVEGKDRPVEYAVKMQRLPATMMMDSLLKKDKVTPQMLDDVAAKLAEFHGRAATGGDVDVFGGLDTIKQNTEENFSQTEVNIGRTIEEPRYRRIKDYTENFIQDNAALFAKRVAGGRIRDCHGDLHAPHICFHDGIVIYDCIEFNDRFRYCDVASEVAFLAMDLDNYGKKELSKSFVASYIEHSGDKQLAELMPFYKCYRAYVRGKVEGFKLDDPYISRDDKEKIKEVASGYYRLAESYI